MAWKLRTCTAEHDTAALHGMAGSADICPGPGMLIQVVLRGSAQLQVWDDIPGSHVLARHRIKAAHLHSTCHP